ncbi:MAG: Uma2 family endonuclease [Elainellaceae cyanobacterium]
MSRARPIATHRRMTLEEYLAYDGGTDTRTELVDGVVVDMGDESTLNTQIVLFLVATFLQLGVPYYQLGIKQQIAVSSAVATARDPDLMLHSPESARAISGLKQALLLPEMPPPALVIEVVSPGQENRERDYVAKYAEYAARGIPEYWIIDPAAAHIIVCLLNNTQYQQTVFRGDELIGSAALPALHLTAHQVLSAGL